ncbi:uncharacterized protein LOC107420795 isoform X2 [Ziziphus jujuba]|uniref:Uncharacterized protein LOC107420795 isoform X2 n=1 Tax=Ziziphus jujuba TaxID=326968 RepID=A0A6P6G8W3_ZIZJJ|nr:uncharacterized protein LOC107420795 isoform X2 [Ziziphus jujuba]
MMILSINLSGGGHGCASFPSSATSTFKPRKKIQVIRVEKATNSVSDSKTKKANLSAARKERIKLPNYGDGFGDKTFHIREFLSQPSGIEAMLNTSALKSFQSIDANNYRKCEECFPWIPTLTDPRTFLLLCWISMCTLQKVQFLNFEAAPVLDLRVTQTIENCTVEMLSCKFEGSEILEQQNNHFSAFMVNHMTWDRDDLESYLEVDVKLNLTLEIYTRPFTMMPASAVERPGNLITTSTFIQAVDM